MRIAIVGGSIAGLAMGWALKEKGMKATVYERSRGHLTHRGAGVMLAPEVASMLELTSRKVEQRLVLNEDLAVVWQRPVAKRAVLWADVYMKLRERSEGVELLDGCRVTEIRQNPLQFTVGAQRQEADLVIGADGLGSVVRGLVDPDFQPEYLGYTAIRGVVPRDRLPKTLPPVFESLFDNGMAQIFLRGEHITAYGLPSDPPVLNWMWYKNTTLDKLDEYLTDREGKKHRWSIPPHGLSQSVEQSLRQAAAEQLPAGLGELVAATDDIFLQPIYCGSAARNYKGNVILIGDAAHLAVPHAGAGVSLAIKDALALAETL
ncbi:MAG: FAD-dependent monooxygenase, partial [Candidatus Eremiobacteraeota bacterium]|nr:FAD-dependent monooxygenase [Candidatus Eremiobacteraeota bacterium]